MLESLLGTGAAELDGGRGGPVGGDLEMHRRRGYE